MFPTKKSIHLVVCAASLIIAAGGAHGVQGWKFRGGSRDTRCLWKDRSRQQPPPLAFTSLSRSASRSTLSGSSASNSANDGGFDRSDTNFLNFQSFVNDRYACMRFRRNDAQGKSDAAIANIEPKNPPTASPPNAAIVEQAMQCLDLARRAPSGFNVQPYQLLLISSPAQKAALARYCCGRNADRVRDSDCTAVFLADRFTTLRYGMFREMLMDDNPEKWANKQKALRQMGVYIALFSSGFPLPAWLSGPISWMMRMGMCIMQQIVRTLYPLPTLFGRDTWSQKNTMLVAMTYLLGCTSRGIATCPMEGFDGSGIRRALRIPRRYTIPLIVATGTPYHVVRNDSIGPDGGTSSLAKVKSDDDAGVSHGPPGTRSSSPRYATKDIIHTDLFGQTHS